MTKVQVRKAPIAVLIVVMLLAALLGWRWWKGSTGTNEGLVLYGNVDVREVDLGFRQPGRIATMLAEEGRTVQAGDLLAELDAAPLRDGLAAADAELARASAELRKLRAGNRAQEVARAQQDVQAAQATLVRAAADLQRQSRLQAEGMASERTLQAARALHDEAAARVAALQQTWSLLREGARREDIEGAEARVAAASAARAQAATALGDARLLAPADGVVSVRVREPGEMIGSRDTVYTMSIRNPLHVRAYVGEPHLGRAVPGTEVTLRASSIDKDYKGRIGFVSPRAEFTPKSVETADLRSALVYRLRVVVSDADDRLRQGMPVTVHFGTGAPGT